MTNTNKTYAIIRNVVAASAVCVLCQGAMADVGGDIGRINGGGNGGTNELPVPATLALVGIGIAGLVAARRNKRK